MRGRVGLLAFSLMYCSLSLLSIVPCVHALGDPQGPLSQLDSNDDMDPGGHPCHAASPRISSSRAPSDGARPDLDKALCGLASWFGVVPGTDQPDGGPANEPYLRLPNGLAFDQSTISVKLPFAAYGVDEENAAVGAWALLEPIEGGSNELEEECGGDQGRRTSSRAQTPNVRNIDQLG